MSVVTDVWIVVGDVDDPGARISAERQVERVALAVQQMFGWESPPPVISLMRDDWRELQRGSKVAGSAAIWVGLNHARIEDLEERLKTAGFRHVTIWSHHENRKASPPRVTSF